MTSAVLRPDSSTLAGRRVWRAYVVAASSAVAAYFAPFVPYPTAMILYCVVVATTPVAMVVGVRWHRPHPVAPWLLVAGGLAAIAAGDVVWTVEDLDPDLVLSSPSIVDLIYVTGYALVAGGLLGITRARLPGRDVDAALDAAIVATSAALASWVLVMAPLLDDPTLGPLEEANALAQPALVVVQLAVLARLALSGGRRPGLLVAVVLGTLAWLAADSAYSVQSLTHAYVDRGVVDLGWIAGSLVWAAVALHPGMARVTERAPERARPPGPGRVAVLAAAALVTPLLMLVELRRTDEAGGQLAVLAAGSAVLFVLVVVRLDVLARRLQRATRRDELTGLANRPVLLDQLTRALLRARRTGRSVAVLFIDLDRFKQVNDTLGHDAGDELLVVVADRLRAASREVDTVARFGGDEFVVLCEDLTGTGDVHEIATRLLETLRLPVTVRDVSFFVSASIGVALADPDVVDPEDVVRDADTALYRAKDHGRGRYELFDQAARVEALRRGGVERDLHRALEHDELEVHYQPVVRLLTDTIVGVEALVRWRDPERGLVPPDEFLDVAEDTGLIVPLGRQVMATAIRQLGAWHRAGATDLELSLNLSPRELVVPGVVDRLAAELGTAGVPPGQLCVEVTETAVFQDLAHGSRVLHQLRELGVRVAMDDFGTGYASLTYLRELPVEVVKLDRSFVRPVGDDPAAASIVSAVVDMATALGLTVVGEGVETRRQRGLLLELGCTLGQGFLWSRPVPAAELGRLLGTGVEGRPVGRSADHLR